MPGPYEVEGFTSEALVAADGTKSVLYKSTVGDHKYGVFAKVLGSPQAPACSLSLI